MRSPRSSSISGLKTTSRTTLRENSRQSKSATRRNSVVCHSISRLSASNYPLVLPPQCKVVRKTGSSSRKTTSLLKRVISSEPNCAAFMTFCSITLRQASRATWTIYDIIVNITYNLLCTIINSSDHNKRLLSVFSNLHFLNCRAAVQFLCFLSELGLHIAPDVDEASFDNLELPLSLLLELLPLGSVLFLETLHLFLMLCDEEL